ncbi:MAG: PHP domain-containing protein [Alphaproteobacteria bacterium]
MLKQKFSYHTHTNSFGLYDGRNSLSEMLKQAEVVGYEEIGVSNHLCYHPNLPHDHTMFFSDFDKAIDVYKRTIEEIREASVHSNLKIYAGFEVDYFSNQKWLDAFEKIKEEVKADYYIGAVHFFKTEAEDVIFNIYHLPQYQEQVDKYGLEYFIRGYWNNLTSAVESQLFDFIAHLDVLKTFEWYKPDYCLDEQSKLL